MSGRTKRPALFLDRDGTIIEDRGHIDRIEQVEFYPFAVDALKMLHEKYLLFIVTNQSGISLGEISGEGAAVVNDHVSSVLRSHGITIQQTYCCVHTRDENCPCIKPKPYFIHKADRDYGIDIAASYTIGDHPHDVEFGYAAGAMGLYVLTGHGHKHAGELPPDKHMFDDILQAAVFIRGQ